MILGLGHLGLVTRRKNKLEEKLLNCGFQTVFEEIALQNAKEKWRFMSEPRSNHDLSMYKNSSGLNLEIIDYNIADMYESGTSVYCQDWSITDSTLALKMKSNEITDDAALLKGIGFVPNESGGYEFHSSIFKNTVSIELIGNEDEDNAVYLDDEGTSVVAFYSTDVESDTKRLKELSADATPSFTTSVQQKELKISILKSHSNLYIELFEVLR